MYDNLNDKHTSTQQTNPAATFFSEAPTYQAPIVPQKKKRRRLIPIVLIVIFVIIGLVAGYYFTKSSADKEADSYTKSEKAYLNKAHDTIIMGVGTLTDVQSSINKTSQPKLGFVLFGGISTKYASAQNLETGANKSMQDVNAQLSSIIAMYNYENSGNKIMQNISSLSKPPAVTSIQYLKNELVYQKQMKTLIDDNKDNVPSGLRSGFDNLSSEYSNLISDLTTLLSDYTSNNTDVSTLLTSITNDYGSINSTLSESQFTSYKILSEYNTMAVNLKSYIDAIK